MNIANGPNRPLPANLSPPLTKCYQITLPDDTDFQAAFFDALYQLTYWFAWARDDAHSGAIVARTWMNILATLRSCRPEPASEGCCGDGDTQLIRQNPDNPCLIESSMDGTHWCTLADLSLCIPSTGQPGPGTDQPPAGGGEACYQAALSASSQWLLPTVVSEGDVLDFSAFDGAGTDGAGFWYCTDGETFFAGNCVGNQFTSGGDPAPSLHHMTLIAHIGSVYYDITAGSITVPVGISNAPVTIQVNDVSLSDNSGDYKFKVCVTNNASVGWTSIMDFAINPYSFFNVPADDGGAWSGGSGWESTQVVLGDGNCYEGLAIRKNFTAALIDSVRFDAFLALGTGGGIFSLEIVEYIPARTSRATTPNGAGAKSVTYSPAGSMSNFEFNCAVGTTTGPCGTPPGGSLVSGKCTVTGHGPKPPEFP